MGKYLNPCKLPQMRTTYFRPEGVSCTIFPARVNANLSDISVSLSERDTEVTEALYREAAALLSY